MKMKYAVCLCASIMILTSCEDVLNTKYDNMMLESQICDTESKMQDLGIAAYTYIPSGFNAIDNNLMATISDEAEYFTNVADAEKFNNGSWNEYENPLDCYTEMYKGIRAAWFFLEKTADYKEMLAHNRDTVTFNGHDAYVKSVENIGRLRAENLFLVAYFYFELVKRYGDVPFVDHVLATDQDTDLPKMSVEDVVAKIVELCSEAEKNICQEWKTADKVRDGRVSLGAVLTLKAKALQLVASPLYNTAGDNKCWQRAADAARAVIDMNYYVLDSKYSNLFLANRPGNSKEVIFALRLGETNDMEKSNYPTATAGGATGVCPSQNLVDAYETVDGSAVDPANPYDKRDPRLLQTIVVNNSSWTGRTIEVWNGGQDCPQLPNRSRTGYYLKKFLNDGLDLQQDAKKLRSWIVYRYADVLLMYAEAMNNAYGPDGDHYGDGKTARWAVNSIRQRGDVKLPDVVAVDEEQMMKCIKRERQVELAFEGHRYWDLLRWRDAEVVLNQPLRGVSIEKTTDGFKYEQTIVENRVFDASKMYRFPFPAAEVGKTKGALTQNAGW